MAKTLTFAELPAELRNEIYNHVLLQSETIELHYAYTGRRFEEPGLLMTSAWIRREALAIFYGSNTFEAPSVEAAKRFLSKVIAGGPNETKTRRFMLVKNFRPVQCLVMEEHRPWVLEPLRKVVNQALACGLSPSAVQVARRGDDRTISWMSVEKVKAFEVVDDARGKPRIELKIGFSHHDSLAKP